MYQKQNRVIVFFFIFLSLWFCRRNNSFGQTADENLKLHDIIEQARQIYGPDDFIERGLIYIPQHPKANGHPYFTDNDWSPTSLWLLGKQYLGYEIKYDISLDHVILKKPIKGTGVNQPLLLQNSLIDQFSLGEYHFTNLHRIDSSGTLSGFAQIIYQGDFIFYQTFNKEFVNQYTSSNPLGFYSKLRSEYYIFKNGDVTNINGKKSLLNYFKLIQKPLKKQMRNNHFRFKKATISEFNQIMTFCEDLLSGISD